MLGENHSLAHDFPDHQDAITKLIGTDQDFANAVQKYNALDKEIRTLELRGGPIDDTDMHQLKHERAEMKDTLFQRLVDAS